MAKEVEPDDLITFEVIENEPVQVQIEGKEGKGYEVFSNCEDREFVAKLLINLGHDILERHM